LRGCVREFVFAAVSGLPESFNLFQLLQAKFVDVLVECQVIPYVRRMARGKRLPWKAKQ
jgi:hypothetical protein